MEPTQALPTLFQKYLQNQCTPAEIDELLSQLEDESNNGIKSELIQRNLAVGREETGYHNPELKEKLARKLGYILQQIDVPQKQKSSVISLGWFRIAAAAILILLAGGGYFLFFDKPSGGNQVTKTTVPLMQDVAAPVTANAIITLANGKQIILDSVKSGALTPSLSKLADGQVAYNTATNAEVEFHTLTVPRGSKVVQLALADGSKVWMNSASSLRYPTAFLGNERKVEITGEAYFEVAKDEGKKFRVTSGGITTEVLGTHFNVNAYDNESEMKITLLEGSVKVSKAGKNSTLKPGQQAQVTNNNNGIAVVNNVDVEAVMAWKNGLFMFNNTDIQTMMRQAERWYNISVSYPNRAPADRFGGTIARNVNLSQFLKILEYSEVNVKIEGKTVIVKP